MFKSLEWSLFHVSNNVLGAFFALKFADPKANYEIVDADSGRKTRMSSEELRTCGYPIALPERKSSALLRIRRLGASVNP